MIKPLIIPAFIATFCAFSALAETPSNDPPAFKTFQVGQIKVTSLHDKDNVFPNDGKILGVDVGAKAVAKVLSDAGAPTDSIKLSVDGLLVREGNKNILIDTGLGPKALKWCGSAAL